VPGPCPVTLCRCTGHPGRGRCRPGLPDTHHACGAAGLNFLTVLGSHEGEGLLLEQGAHVAGSKSALISGQKGQVADLKICEVALFFMREISAAQGAPAEAGGSRELSVILLSNDNGQIQVREQAQVDVLSALVWFSGGGISVTSSVSPQRWRHCWHEVLPPLRPFQCLVSAVRAQATTSTFCAQLHPALQFTTAPRVPAGWQPTYPEFH
jgi:hypothetical protein